METNTKHDREKLNELLNSFQFKFAQKILAQRLQLGLTRKQIAQKLNMSELDYIEIERGQNFQMSEREYEKTLQKVSNIKA